MKMGFLPNGANARDWVRGAAVIILFYGLPIYSEPAGEGSGEGSAPPSLSGEGAGFRDKAAEQLSTGAWVNEYTAQAAFTVPLATVSNHGGISFALSLRYFGGGLESRSQSKPKYNPVSWVGEGFGLAAPSISSQPKGTLTLEDDEYFISLDGQSSVPLIPESGNPDVLYPSNNPSVKVQRERATATLTPAEPWANVGGSPPTSVPSQTADYITGWTVVLPDGSKYKYGSGSAGCDANNAYSFCIPCAGEKIGYQPFYNYGTGATSSQMPVQWYLREIRSMDNQFSIFLDYAKVTSSVTGISYASGSGFSSPSLQAERAIYLSRVYSVNGTLPTSPRITTVVLNRETRNPADYFDNSASDPLARFETQRLESISTFFRDNAVPEATYRLKYSTSSEYARTRLKEIRGAQGGRERRLYSFQYDDPGNGWRMKSVKAPNSMEWGYTYSAAGQSFSLGPQALDLKSIAFGGTNYNAIADFTTKPQVFMSQEVGDKLYVGLEDGLGCPSEPSGDRWKRRLVELKNFGTHWAVQRVFKSPEASCSDNQALVISPDGSYMAWANKANVRIFALKPQIGANGVIDLASPPAQLMLLSSTLRKSSTTSTPKPVIFPFNNWFAAYDVIQGRSITFFHKTASGGWARNEATGCATPPPGIVQTYIDEGLSLIGKCLDWEPSPYSGVIEVRGGNDFIAVKFNELVSLPEFQGSTIRVYAYRNGVLKEFREGLLKSRKQKGISTRKPATLGAYNMADRDFIWDPEMDNGFPDESISILDIAARGNLIGLVLGRRSGSSTGSPRYLHVFSFDGLQLRFLYQTDFQFNITDQNGAHVFLGENYFAYRNEYNNTFNYYTFNPRSWSNPVMSSLPALSTTSFKALDGHFHIENMSDRKLSFKPAVVGTATYGATSCKLFAVDPANGSLTQVTGLDPHAPALPQPRDLCNAMQSGDKFLGVMQNANAGNAWTYVYGQLGSSGYRSQWLPIPSGVAGMSASLVSTGVMGMDQASNGGISMFNGVLRFFGEYKGSIMTASSTPPSTVTRVTVSTKGAESALADGSLRELDISYPASPRLNYASKVPNMNQVAVTTAGSRKMTTDYIVDYTPRDPTLAPKTIFQGLASSSLLSNGQTGTGTRPGDVRTQYRYKTNTISSGWDGTALKETIKIPFMTKTTNDRYYFDASRTTETRFAVPDAKTGQAQLAIKKIGTDYHVSVTRFRHEFGASAANDLPAQTATYLIKGTDPCTGSNPDDPCSNLVDTDWLKASAYASRATASQVFSYTSLGYPLAQYSWRSKTSDVSALTTLEGTTPSTNYETQGKWIKEKEALFRPADHASVLAKHGLPTVSDARGVRSTTFYSGREGQVLATVKNASKAVCTFLDAEEEVGGTGRGAFGDWETQGTVSYDMAHTGTRSIKTTTGFGPTVNVAFRRDDNFWSRSKGLVVSGWMFVPSAAANPNPAAFIELRVNATTQPATVIDILGAYKAAHNNSFPYDRWFKLERLVTWSELNSIPFTQSDGNSNPLLRIWFGKADPAANAYPVYLDDLRVHPADAVMMSQTYDAARRVSSRSEAENNPKFFQYDAWGGILSVKDDKGRLFSTNAYKRIED